MEVPMYFVFHVLASDSSTLIVDNAANNLVDKLNCFILLYMLPIRGDTSGGH